MEKRKNFVFVNNWKKKIHIPYNVFICYFWRFSVVITTQKEIEQ